MRKTAVALLLTALLAVLTACSASHEFHGGAPLGREDLESMSAALFDEETTASAETDAPGTVYWTEDGEVYHLDRSCPYLAKSAHIKSGPRNNAVMLYGKDRPCSACGKE